jgi:hypothetical protein
MKLNCTHQLLVYVDDVYILGGSVHTAKENIDALIVASMETGLELNADKIKYMIMSREENVGRSHNIKIYNRSFEMVEQFRCLGTNLKKIKMLFR